MSRPVIMKVDRHAVQRRERAVGSIEVPILTKFNNYSTYARDVQDAVDSGSGYEGALESSSMVRRLISKYEKPSSSTSGLLKGKSKSLVELSVTKKVKDNKRIKSSQDDYLYDREHYNKDVPSVNKAGKEPEEQLGFKQIVNMFETSSKKTVALTKKRTFGGSVPYGRDVVIGSDNFISQSIKHRAARLLENFPGKDFDVYWQENVADFLRDITDIKISSSPLNTSSTLNTSENSSALESNFDNYNDSRLRKVDEIESVENSFVGNHVGEELVTRDNVFEECDDDSNSNTSDGTLEAASVKPSSTVILDENMLDDVLELLKIRLKKNITKIRKYAYEVSCLSYNDVEEKIRIRGLIQELLDEASSLSKHDNQIIVELRDEIIQMAQKCIEDIMERMSNGDS